MTWTRRGRIRALKASAQASYDEGFMLGVNNRGVKPQYRYSPPTECTPAFAAGYDEGQRLLRHKDSLPLDVWVRVLALDEWRRAE